MSHFTYPILTSLLSLALFELAGCSQQAAQGTDVTKAVAVLQPTQGNPVDGMVTFTQEEGAIRVVADVNNLTAGKHGFHVHEYGDCSAPDAASAGGHFNPENQPHGGPASDQRHVGDLGNIEANGAGKAQLDQKDDLLAFSGAHSIIGRSVIVHAGADDLSSQPSGNAGPRVACGVIGIAQ